MRIKVLLIVVLSAMTLLAGGVSIHHWTQGNADEVWESSNKAAFRVRVLKYSERSDIFLPGARYVFQSAPVGSQEWKEIMTFRHDDPVSIPHEQVRFVSERIGYVFMGWKYALTTDGGASWFVWDASQNLPGWKCCHYKLIKEVLVQEDGSGTMTLNSGTQLYTRDYGRYWGEKH